MMEEAEMLRKAGPVGPPCVGTGEKAGCCVK